ncbi:uncharacterized protein N7529_006136 [Penicillium soppii]|uniref:uncharacterized protein n=1 Tax=Penicillium soppii TaxID=69789 RepID=UPI002548AA21|nr:uncharacterized protein N7529_006136 [Penicillium soppii]KAJ5864220.1 hypothetical protein N7529_006136 [Penicillium soppii]
MSLKLVGQSILANEHIWRTLALLLDLIRIETPYLHHLLRVYLDGTALDRNTEDTSRPGNRLSRPSPRDPGTGAIITPSEFKPPDRFAP